MCDFSQLSGLRLQVFSAGIASLSRVRAPCSPDPLQRGSLQRRSLQRRSLQQGSLQRAPLADSGRVDYGRGCVVGKDLKRRQVGVVKAAPPYSVIDVEDPNELPGGNKRHAY